MSTLSSLHRATVLTVVMLALAARVLVPAGWMPSSHAGRATITLCTGQGVVEAWIDADGGLHKEMPEGGSDATTDCVFSALSIAHHGPIAEPGIAPKHDPQHVLLAATSVTIGHGLAAPPPPARGPPFLI